MGRLDLKYESDANLSLILVLYDLICCKLNKRLDNYYIEKRRKCKNGSTLFHVPKAISYLDFLQVLFERESE